MKLSIVIVNYNVKYFLEQCLVSVRRAVAGIDAEVIVVDNASSDGSVEYLKPRFEDVTFIASDKNLGFARANNLAIRKSKGEYVLLLNPDTIIGERTLAEFISFMDSHGDAGGCGTYMMRTNGTFAFESRRGLPTPFVAFCKMSGLASLFPKSHIFGRYYMRYLNEREINSIEIISGAFMFIRKEALEYVGLLDETFFMYGEDIDLSYRLLKGGYKNYFLPSPIIHYKGESTHKSSFKYVHTFYQAMQIFFKKHYSHYSFLVSLPIRFAIWSRAMLVYVGNQFRHRKGIVKMRPQLNCLVLGSEEANREVKEILERQYPKGEHRYVTACEAKLPAGHFINGIDLERFDTVVYDTDAYSYDAIFKIMQDKPVVSLKLGTYSAKSKVLITENAVMKK